jgi:hypothetical protein
MWPKINKNRGLVAFYCGTQKKKTWLSLIQGQLNADAQLRDRFEAPAQTKEARFSEAGFCLSAY